MGLVETSKCPKLQLRSMLADFSVGHHRYSTGCCSRAILRVDSGFARWNHGNDGPFRKDVALGPRVRGAERSRENGDAVATKQADKVGLGEFWLLPRIRQVPLSKDGLLPGGGVHFLRRHSSDSDQCHESKPAAVAYVARTEIGVDFRGVFLEYLCRAVVRVEKTHHGLGVVRVQCQRAMQFMRDVNDDKASSRHGQLMPNLLHKSICYKACQIGVGE